MTLRKEIINQLGAIVHVALFSANAVPTLANTDRTFNVTLPEEDLTVTLVMDTGSIHIKNNDASVDLENYRVQNASFDWDPQSYGVQSDSVKALCDRLTTDVVTKIQVALIPEITKHIEFLYNRLKNN